MYVNKKQTKQKQAKTKQIAQIYANIAKSKQLLTQRRGRNSQVTKRRNANRKRSRPSGKRYNRGFKGRSKANRTLAMNHNALMNKLGGVGEGASVIHQWDSGVALHMGSYQDQDGNGDRTRVFGSEFLKSVEVKSTLAIFQTNPGEILVELPISLRLLFGTRIEILSREFQKVKYHGFGITAVPQASSLQNGSVTCFINHDPDYDIANEPVGELMERRALNYQGAQQHNVYNAVTVGWHTKASEEFWLDDNDTDMRFSTPGTYYMTSSSSYAPFDGTSTEILIYNLWIHYDVEFISRAVLTPELPLAVAYVSDAGVANTILCYFGQSTVAVDEEVCFEPAILPVNYQNASYIYQLYVEAEDSSTYPGITIDSSGPGERLMIFNSTTLSNYNYMQGNIMYLRWNNVDVTTGSLSLYSVYSSFNNAKNDHRDVRYGLAYGSTETIRIKMKLEGFKMT